MTVDEYDKYLAYLPQRKTRSNQRAPTSSLYSTESNSSTKKSNSDLKGPRLPTKYNTYSDNRSQQDIPITTLDNIYNEVDEDEYDKIICSIRSYRSEPSYPTQKSTTTATATATTTKNKSINNVYNNIIHSLDNISMNEDHEDDDDQNNIDDHSTVHSKLYNIDNNNIKTMDNKKKQNTSSIMNTIQHKPNQDDNDDNNTYYDNQTPQEKYIEKEKNTIKNDNKPPIPTFSFGINNDNQLPIPTFSFGDNQENNNNNDDNDIPIDLSTNLRCGSCDQLINGMAITAVGKRWHTDCFKCHHCKQDLEHIAFYVKDHLPYCALDYHELFTTRCDFCHTPIEEKLISALGKNYHEGHLFCRECGKAFDENSIFMEHNGYPYCEKDYLSKFAQKCKGCKEDITSEFIEALNGKWHLTCFVCVDCGKAFEDNTFYVRNELPYCERHSLKLKKP